MTERCLICLQPGSLDNGYHRKCMNELFGASNAPTIELDTGIVQAAGLAMAGRSSLSGVQKKLSVKLSGDLRSLQIVSEGGSFILKPQTGTFQNLPEIEHTTMQMASLCRIETAANGLLRLHDGSLAYLTKRFDRRGDGSKVHQEDFCQLLEQRPADKYRGSAERCMKVIARFASEPGIEMMRLMRQLLYSWWVGNGDLHLKNLSLIMDEFGRVRLSPAYDLVSTQLVIRDDKLALTIAGRDQNIMFTTWYRLSDHTGFPRPAMKRLMADQIKVLPKALQWIAQSFLPEWQKEQLKRIITANSAQLKKAF